jgi:hypothetical protein
MCPPNPGKIVDVTLLASRNEANWIDLTSLAATLAEKSVAIIRLNKGVVVSSKAMAIRAFVPRGESHARYRVPSVDRILTRIEHLLGRWETKVLDA